MSTAKKPAAGAEENDASTPEVEAIQKRRKCGIIMPIAEMPGYSEKHWAGVKRTIQLAATKADFDCEMVSTGADVGVIHKHIINNIFTNEIIVCDVSGKNANVMFELGLRLASKLPVIIIKDELTGYSFDTSPIQHLGYLSGLPMFETQDFIDDLAIKLQATYEASQKPGYSTFLDNFGTYKLAALPNESVGADEMLSKLLSRIDDIDYKVDRAISTKSTDSSAKDSLKKINDTVNTLNRVIHSTPRYAGGGVPNPYVEPFLISLDSALEAESWCKYFDCTLPELREAVRSAGVKIKDLKAYFASRNS